MSWSLLGTHNASNALAAIAAASNVGVSVTQATKALTTFKNVKRRLQCRGTVNGVTIYDDFAHHPTAIATTLAGLRAHVGNQRIIAVLEMASYTMKTGHHSTDIAKALQLADQCLILRPEAATWDINDICTQAVQPTKLYETVAAIVKDLKQQTQTGDHILIMSNRSFDNIFEKLLTTLEEKTP